MTALTKVTVAVKERNTRQNWKQEEKQAKKLQSEKDMGQKPDERRRMNEQPDYCVMMKR